MKHFLGELPIIGTIFEKNVLDKEGLEGLFAARVKETPLNIGPRPIRDVDVKDMIGENTFPFDVTWNNENGMLPPKQIHDLKEFVKTMNVALGVSTAIRVKGGSPTFEILPRQHGS